MAACEDLQFLCHESVAMLLGALVADAGLDMTTTAV